MTAYDTIIYVYIMSSEIYFAPRRTLIAVMSDKPPASFRVVKNKFYLRISLRFVENIVKQIISACTFILD